MAAAKRPSNEANTTMRAPLLFAIAAAGLAGCVANPDKGSGPMTGNYACRLQGGRERAANAVAHQVAIMPDSQASSIRAAVDAKPVEVLALVKESRAPLFASDTFAWRPQADAAPPTDIQSAHTFACLRDAATTGAPGDAPLIPPPRPAAFLRRGYDHG